MTNVPDPQTARSPELERIPRGDCRHVNFHYNRGAVRESAADWIDRECPDCGLKESLGTSDDPRADADIWPIEPCPVCGMNLHPCGFCSAAGYCQVIVCSKCGDGTHGHATIPAIAAPAGLQVAGLRRVPTSFAVVPVSADLSTVRTPLRVERRGSYADDLWIIAQHGQVWTRDTGWDYDVQPSSRTEMFNARTLWTLDEAMTQCADLLEVP